jgi:hypothetical protein
MFTRTWLNLETVNRNQSESNLARPKGRFSFTGQRLKTLRLDIYRRAVELLAEPREQVTTIFADRINRRRDDLYAGGLRKGRRDTARRCQFA